MLKQAALSKDKLGYSISVALDELLGALAAIVELSEDADDTDKSNKHYDVQVQELYGELNDDQQEAVAQAWQIISGEVEGLDGDFEEDDDEIELENLSTLLQYKRSGLKFLDPHAADVFQFMLRRASRLAVGGSRPRLIRRSLVSTGVSAFEQFIGSLIDHVLSHIPAILEASEYAFTLKDLDRFRSVEDARKELRERKVQSLLAEGLEGWQKFFARRDVGVDISDIEDSYSFVREFIARRNLLTHRNGVIDEKYLRIIGDMFDSEPKLGMKAFVGAGYMKQGAHCLAGVACALAYKLWTRLHQSESEIAQRHMVELQDELIELEFWGAVIDIKEAIPDGKFANRELLFQSSIHRWTAYKFGPYSTQQMFDEVREWDTTGLDTKYGHSKHLLLDDTERAREALAALYAEGKVVPSKPRRNPLYRAPNGNDANAVED